MDSRHVGRETERRAFAVAGQALPDTQWPNGHHFVQGEFGVSPWTFVGTGPDGRHIEADAKRASGKSPRQDLALNQACTG